MNGWRHLYRIQRLIALRSFGQRSDQLGKSEKEPVSLGTIFKTWLPLAATWMLMTAEGPLMAAFVARQVAPELNLAAWSVVFPIVMILSAPGITLLSASTALVKDYESYTKIRRFVLWLIAVITSLHLLLAFTPAFDFFMQQIMGAPPELLEPVRNGLRIMVPFSAALSYRRFVNGVLIRFGRANTVTIGATIRLLVDGLVLLICTWIGGVAGVVGAAVAISCAVIAEFIYARSMVKGILDNELLAAPKVEEALTFRSFMGFYLPLVLTTLIYVFVQPMIASALSRMPLPISSLAAWPVIYGIIMLVSSSSFAFTEVVVVMLDKPNAKKSLIRFTLIMASCMAMILLIFNATELANLWLVYVAALPPELIEAVRSTLWFAILIPALQSADSLFSGTLINSRRTRGITEAAIISLCMLGIVLATGVAWGAFSGLRVGIAASFLGGLVRTLWLARQAGPLLRGDIEAETG